MAAQSALGIADVGPAFLRMIQLEPREPVRFAERRMELLERTTFAEMMFQRPVTNVSPKSTRRSEDLRAANELTGSSLC